MNASTKNLKENSMKSSIIEKTSHSSSLKNSGTPLSDAGKTWSFSQETLTKPSLNKSLKFSKSTSAKSRLDALLTAK